jgi:hypothetical protein
MTDKEAAMFCQIMGVIFMILIVIGASMDMLKH